MRTFYDANDDILTLHISDAPIVREVSPDWNTCISYAADGSVVEVVVLEASQQGGWPLPGQIRGGQPHAAALHV